MMTHKQLSALYEASSIYESRVYIEGPLRYVLLAVAGDTLMLIAADPTDDDVFPAIGPLKSFDHAWSVLTMRGYTVREYD